MKAMWIGMLLASLSAAAWTRGGPETSPATADLQSPAASEPLPPVQIPVEVVATGNASEWKYVEISPQAIPEPGVAMLMATASLALLRRRRPGGK